MTGLKLRWVAFPAALPLLVLILCVAAAPASAATLPQKLTVFPEEPSLGQAAGQLDSANRMAVDQATGHIYVAEAPGHRISEFTAWGEYLKTWGWGVADGSAELQVCGTKAQPHCQHGLAGSSPGEMRIVIGMGVGPTGNVYVLEPENFRVQVFDAAGGFLRNFGKDVVAHGPDDSGKDEIQTVKVAAHGGAFKLRVDSPFVAGGSFETGALPSSASAAEVKAALDAVLAPLSSSVGVSGGPGDETGSTPYEVTFEGDIGGDDVSPVHLNVAQGAGAQLKCLTTAKTKTPTVAYQWLRNGTPISGATAAEYTVTAEDEGKAIQCQVTGTSAGAGTTQIANPAQIIAPFPATDAPQAPSSIPPPPQPAAPLVVGGSGGQTLTCPTGSGGPDGTWRGSPTFSYRWYRNGAPIGGATASTYTVTAADLASAAYFQCGVTGTNAGGSVAITSEPIPTTPSPEPLPSFETSMALMSGGVAQSSAVKTVQDGGSSETCVPASGDVCKSAVPGLGSGEFSGEANGLTVGAEGTVYVGDANRIEEFASTGAFEKQIPLPKSGRPANLVYDQVTGGIWMNFSTTAGVIGPLAYEIDPKTGAVLREVPIGLDAPTPGTIDSLATDEEDNLFVIFGTNGGKTRILEYDKSGKEVIGFEDAFALPPALIEPGGISLQSLAANAIGDLYVLEAGNVISRVSAYGPPPSPYGPPPALPPTIEDQFAAEVDTTGATVQAQINPRFWSDTHYYLEYGTASCESIACTTQGGPPGSLLTKEVVNVPLASAGMALTGLQPNTTYHYRFVAKSGGGETHGLTGKSGEAAEGTFTTYPAGQVQPPCPGNEAFRSGAAALLPDCRAYEMVSPVDKNGADVSVLYNSFGDLANLDQARSDGEALTYSAYRAFGDAQSSPYTSQYLAARTPSGWQSTSISPPRSGPSFLPTRSLDSEYGAISPDLCQGWLVQDTENPLAEGAFPGFTNLYRRDLCGAGYEHIAPSVAPQGSPGDFRPEVQAFSSDGSKTFFRAPGKLTANASTALQLYEAIGGQLRLVCILPTSAASKNACTAGNQLNESAEVHPGRVSNVQNAVSADGAVVYWTDMPEGERNLYVRVDHQKTFAVSATKTASFWGAAPDGSRAVFSDEGQLRTYDLESHASQGIAGGFQAVLGVSEDAKRVYFTSGEVIADSGQNSEGDEAVVGKPNLYLYEAGEPPQTTFIATLAGGDAMGGLGAGSPSPRRHASRISPDGSALAFTSTERLTGYDNTDLQSGNPDAEVYLYRAAGNTLACVSCKRTGARPRGRDMRQSLKLDAPFWAAAYLPGAENQLHFSRLLSDDGQRLFFNAVDSLSLRDTNGRQDVYEWEALGKGSCTESAPGFDPKSGGCLNLISTGGSPVDSEFVDAGSDGRDVFFKTAESLFPTDPGLVDVYDARASGGFPVPPQPPAACEGEACQGPLAPSEDPTPASSVFQGAGNVKPPAHRKKHRRKQHKTRHHKSRGHHNLGVGR